MVMLFFFFHFATEENTYLDVFESALTIDNGRKELSVFETHAKCLRRQWSRHRVKRRGILLNQRVYLAAEFERFATAS